MSMTRRRMTVPFWGVVFLYLAAVMCATGADERPIGMSLSEAIELALKHNPELSAQGHDLGVAEARYDAALGRRLPGVDVVGTAMYYQYDQRLLPATANGEAGAFSDKMLSSDIVFSLPIYTGGRLRREQSAARLLRASAERQLARSRSELIYNVSSVYYGILAQRRVIASLEFSREALREHSKRVQEMISVQKAAGVDRLRMDVRVADLEQRMVWEKNVLAVQCRVLANLLGLPAGSPRRTPMGELPELPTASAAALPALAVVLANRSDYQAAQAAIAAQREAVAAASAGHLPTVTVQGSYGRRLAVESSDRRSGLDSTTDMGWGGVVFNVPVFAGGQVSARVREERARLAAAEERLRKLALQIELELETASLNIQSARERLEALAKTSEQAQESLRIEREKYELGKGSITDVLDAQTALLDTETAMSRALADYHTARAQLALAKGE